MSEIKALDKLLEWARIATTADDPIWGIVGEIEQEIAERYMELPMDADGVPIHVHDTLECHAHGYHGTFSVLAAGKNVVVGNHDIEWVRDNPSKWFHIAPACTHVKPRTLEDVLCDMIHEYGCTDALTETIADKYAAEIREFMAGDAE